MQKRLSGELMGWDAQTRRLHVRFRKWWEASRHTEATAAFVVDRYAIVTSAHRETLQLSELQVNQRVTLTYVTGADGQPVAKTLVVSCAHAPAEQQAAVFG